MYEDALRELGNVAFSHATTALSTLVGRRVDLASPHVRILPAPSVLDVTQDAESNFHVAIIRIFGERQGSIALIMSDREANELCRMLSLSPPGTPQTPVEVAVLGEVANIMSGSALLAIHRFLGVSLVHGTPLLSLVEATQRKAADIRVTPGDDLAIVITTQFRIDARAATGWLIISLEDIRFFLDALDRAMTVP